MKGERHADGGRRPGWRLEWLITRRYLSSRRGARWASLGTVIAIGGVAVGVAALITVIAVMTGLQDDLRGKILGANPHVRVTMPGERVRLVGWRETLERVRRQPGVEAAAAFAQAEVGVSNQAGHPAAALLYGVDPADAQGVTAVVDSVRREGILARPTRSGLPPLVLGDMLAGQLGALEGDTLTAISFQDVRVSPLGTLYPKRRRFEVVGIFRSGVVEYDMRTMLTAMPVAQDMAGLDSDVTGIDVRVPDPMRATAVAGALRAGLSGRHQVQDWQQMNAALFSALRLEKLAMGLILLLVVIVAALNIVSTLVMVVTDKTREIGILKGMGMPRAGILRVFMLQGLAIGVLGSSLGLAAGVGLSWALGRFAVVKLPSDPFFSTHLPVTLQPADVAAIVLCTVALSFAATVYPALQAANLDPLEAIRHE